MNNFETAVSNYSYTRIRQLILKWPLLIIISNQWFSIKICFRLKTFDEKHFVFTRMISALCVESLKLTYEASYKFGITLCNDWKTYDFETEDLFFKVGLGGRR